MNPTFPNKNIDMVEVTFNQVSSFALAKQTPLPLGEAPPSEVFKYLGVEYIEN